MIPSHGEVTQLLSNIDAGNPKAAEELLPLVYEELRKLAAARMSALPPRNIQTRDERAAPTLR
jgi:hypothetical protein